MIGCERPFGGVWAKAAYDESASEWAATAALQLNVPNMTESSFRLLGFYSSWPNAYEVTPYFTGLAGAEWSVLGSFYQQFAPMFGASVGAQYFSDVGYISGIDAWQAEASAV